MTQSAALTPGRERLLIALLSLAAFGSAASIRIVDAQLPALATHFGVGLAAMAHAVTLFSLAYGLMQIAYGSLGDRHGKWRVIAATTFLSALTTATCALAPTYATLIVARLLAGATCAAVIPLSMAWIGDAVPYERRQPVLARFLTGQILGMAGGQWLGGVAADLGLWRLPFVVLAAWFIVAGVLLWRFRAEAAMASPAHATAGRLVHQIREVLRWPWARVVLVVVFTEGMLLFGVLAFFPTHLHLTQGLSLSSAGAVVMLYAAGGLLFALLSAPLVRRLGEPGLARGGGLLLLIGMLLFALSPGWWTAPVACVLTGLGFYMMHNTLQTNATQMAPPARGVAMSLFAGCFFLGHTVGVTLAALAVERWGSAAAIAVCAPLLLMLALTFARLRTAHTAAN